MCTSTIKTGVVCINATHAQICTCKSAQACIDRNTHKDIHKHLSIPFLHLISSGSSKSHPLQTESKYELTIPDVIHSLKPEAS